VKERLDMILVQKKFYDDIEIAKRAIMAGNVIVNNIKIDKPGTIIKLDKEPQIRIKSKAIKYVSRGGLKMEKAINVFKLDFTDAIVLDVGSSTGGFTDCALKHGAKFVYATDVGSNQLDWKLRNNPKVKSIENKHINFLDAADIDNQNIDFITVDVSFISIKNIIDSLKKFMTQKTKLFILIKPQFEAEKMHIEEGGIVKKINIHKVILHDIILACKEKEIFLENLDFSPITGMKGNMEYISLFSLEKTNERNIDLDSVIISGKDLGGKNEYNY
jgi:23S rRNA (cytidine1920-2'-O)/16S rRNA (cytidine1409-2'-O)-methyltransferase